VTRLADIRSIPRSRRHPHFSIESLSASLPAAGIAYRHFPGLGGLRKPRSDSDNTAWRHAGFRGYADYMQTEAFAAGLDELLGLAQPLRTTLMCAEAVWWRCHRALISDALLARDVAVEHILDDGPTTTHPGTPPARIVDGRLTYAPAGRA